MSKMDKIDAIIIGKNYSTSLGIIESLGKAGYRCAVIKLINRKPRYKTPELISKYVVKYEYAKDLDDADIISRLRKYVERSKIALFPSDDYSASLLDRYYDELCSDFFVPNMNLKSGELSAFMDKQYQKKTAKQYGIRVAKCWSIDLSIDRIQFADDIIYPCFTKPLSSIGLPKTFIKKCFSKEDLMSQLNTIKKQRTCKILIEEAIEVEEEYTIPGAVFGGKAYIPALLRKIKIGSGAHKGVTAIGQVLSFSHYSELNRDLCRFIESMGLTGLFDIELLESKGQFYLNEVNLRNSAAGYAVTAAGVNLPGMYIDNLLGRDNMQSETIIDGIIFMNQKAELDDYEAGYCSWKEVKNETRNADIKFISGINDLPSELMFYILCMKTRVTKEIKRIINFFKKS